METKETQCHPKPLVNATCNLGAKGCYGNGKCHYIGNCEHKITTNADSIRAMSDEELTDAIYRLIHANDPALWFCKGTKECGELMDNDEEIPEEMCRKCLLERLQQPAKEG